MSITENIKEIQTCFWAVPNHGVESGAFPLKQT